MPANSPSPGSPLPTEVLILGGYGNFGRRIARALNRHGVPVVIAGRDLARGQALAAELPGARAIRADIHDDFCGLLAGEKPAVVIHTCGPFQGADYAVARACIQAGIHYVDLADGRDFVRDFATLDADAKAAGVVLVSGASTVPGLSSAVVEHFKADFAAMATLDYGISPGQKTERGLATLRGVLSYVGKPLRPYAGHPRPYGWSDLHVQDYPVMGRRFLSACDIPDLDLLPPVYGLRTLRFGAGIELGFLHLAMTALAWLTRSGLPLDLPGLAGPLLALGNLFNGLGSDIGGMHVTLTGTGHDGAPLTRRWFIVAGRGDGPQIPCVPAIILAQRLQQKDPRLATGAYPCVGLVTLEDYLDELGPFAITTY